METSPAFETKTFYIGKGQYGTNHRGHAIATHTPAARPNGTGPYLYTVTLSNLDGTKETLPAAIPAPDAEAVAVKVWEERNADALTQAAARITKVPATQPTDMERDAAKNIEAPAGETPRYGTVAALTYLNPDGWFVVTASDSTGHDSYADALAHWERVEAGQPEPAPAAPKFPDVEVQLSELNGNAYAVVAATKKALRKAGHEDDADEYSREAMSGDYDHLLQVTMAYVTTN